MNDTIDWQLDERRVTEKVIEGLRTLSGWTGVDSDDLSLTNLSGVGGGQTWRIDAGQRAPVVLHTDPPLMCNEAARRVRFDRIREAQALLAEAGLMPARLIEARAENWYLDEYGGDVQTSAAITPDLLREVATLTARLHQIPADWGLKYRARLSESYPGMLADPADHLWVHVTRWHQMLLHTTDDQLRRLGELGPRPKSAVGRRIVTSHGDIHRGNLLRRGDNLLLVDLENVGANYAIADPVYTITVMRLSNAEKDFFAKAYLEALGAPATEADVFELRLDMERCHMAFLWFALDSAWEHDRPPGITLNLLPTLYPALVEIAEEAWRNETLAREIVEKSFARCSPVLEMQADHGQVRQGMPLRARLKETEGPHLLVNWDGTLQPQRQFGPPSSALLAGAERDRVLLVPHGESEHVLRLDLSGGTPVTGVGAFSARSVPLTLSGPHAGSAVIRGPLQETGGEYTQLGDPAHALHVRVARNGRILISASRQQLCLANEDLFLGELNRSPRYPCRFIVHDDGALSPTDQPERVLAWRNGYRLVKHGDPDVLLFDQLAALWQACREDEQLLRPKPDGLARRLLLESHPGKAISIDRRLGDLAVVIVDAHEAEPFLIDKDGIRAERDGVRIQFKRC